MSSNEFSQMQYESGVTPHAMGLLVDSGDHKTFNTNAVLFSEDGVNAPVIRANGVLTGGLITPAFSGGDDLVDVSAMSINLNGVVTVVPATLDLAITRAASDVASISAVTLDASGTVVVVQGTDSADATTVETFGAAGGPPEIPVDSVALGQVRTTTDTAAPLTGTEVVQVVGTHTERADFPIPETDNFKATVNFTSPLILSHTGGVSKRVYASYADPIFTTQKFGNDFVPAETSNAVTSTQVYDATIGTSTSTLGQGSFTAELKNGITDDIIARKNRNLFFKYIQDKTKTPHILTQGKLGLSRTFGATENPKVSVTISAAQASVEVA